MDKSLVDFVIYHGNCPDGFAAAFCAYLYNKDIEFYPAYYNQAPPNIKNKNVLICDFSYPLDITKNIISLASNLLILDHHKSASENLVNNIDEKYYNIDMEHSGVYLAWYYFFPDKEMPLFMRYIQDHDLWHNKMEHINEITTYITTVNFNFDEYNKLLDDNYLLTTCLSSGLSMIKIINTRLEQAYKQLNIQFIELNNNYYLVGFLNSVELKSELGNKIIVENPKLNFSVVYSINYENKHVVSLRSDNKHSDVSLIAKNYNGGGHRNASGILIDNILLFGKNICNINIYKTLSNIYPIESTFSLGNIICINTNIFQYEILKYLLQVRYTDNDTNIQECTSILNIIKQTKNTTFYNYALAFNYDGSTNKTWIYIIAINITYLTALSNITKLYQDYNYNEKYLKITYSINNLTNNFNL